VFGLVEITVHNKDVNPSNLLKPKQRNSIRVIKLRNDGEIIELNHIQPIGAAIPGNYVKVSCDTSGKIID